MENNQVQVFNNEQFGDVRVIMQDEQPWFVGKDVASMLGYGDTAQAIRKRVENEDKGVVELTTPEENRELLSSTNLVCILSFCPASSLVLNSSNIG